MGSLAAYALEEKRKLDEERAKQEAREAHEEERREKIKDKQMEKLETKWAQERAWEAAREAKEREQEARYLSHMEARVEGREIKEEAKRVAEEKAVERERIEAQRRADEKQEAQERQAAITGSYAALLQRENEAPPQESNWWEKTKSFVSTNIIQPIDKYIYQPYVAPAVEIRNEIQEKVAEWTNKNIYQPYIQPAVDSTKQFLNDASDWVDEKKKMIQEKFASDVEDVKQSLVRTGNWINQKIYQPYVEPYVEKARQNLIEKAALINEKIYQPYIKPAVEKTEQVLKNTADSINEHIYQPYIKPIVDQVVDKATEFIVAEASMINEKIIEPIKSGVDKIVEGIKDGAEWVNENIYQSIFEPVVSDISKYIYKPLADKTEAWWDKYGEWVHGALDAAGFFPGFGEVADGLNGLVYLAEGRYIEAGVSLVSMIPLIGDLGKVGKWGVKLGEDVVEEAAEKVAKELLEETIEEGMEAITEKVAKEAAKELVTETGEEILEQSAKEIVEVNSGVIKDLTEKFYNGELGDITLGNVGELPDEIKSILKSTSDGMEPIDEFKKQLEQLIDPNSIQRGYSNNPIHIDITSGRYYISKTPDEAKALIAQAEKLAETGETSKVIEKINELAPYFTRGDGNKAFIGRYPIYIENSLGRNGVFFDVGESWNDLTKILGDNNKYGSFLANEQFLYNLKRQGVESIELTTDLTKTLDDGTKTTIKLADWLDEYNKSDISFETMSYGQMEALALETSPLFTREAGTVVWKFK